MIQEAIGGLFAKRRGEAGMEKLSRSVFQGIFSHYYEKIVNAYGPLDELQRFFYRCMDEEGLLVLPSMKSKRSKRGKFL